MHVVVGAEVLAVRDTVDAVFASSDDEDDGFGELPAATASPSASVAPTTVPAVPGSVAPPSLPPTPAPTPRPGPLADGRLDILLVGADAGPGRWSLRTDTLVVLSVDEKSGESAIFSIPRNMVNVPLPKESRRAFACRCYPQLINSLYVYASGHPSQFPGNDSSPWPAGRADGDRRAHRTQARWHGGHQAPGLRQARSTRSAGSTSSRRGPCTTRSTRSRTGTGYVKIFIRAGKQHMNGHKALIYARSRHQDSDYGRMDRQQLVIAAVGKKLLKGDLLGRLPKLLKIAKENLWTNLKTGDLPALATLAEQADLKGMRRIRFIPPTYREFLDRRIDQADPLRREARVRQGETDRHAQADRDPVVEAAATRVLTRVSGREDRIAGSAV